ncbi:FAEL018Cp [Eremothecium gossypii FDAG1]|nr:FAEL018Cp [Eremothecium gossypii FDAG1]
MAERWINACFEAYDTTIRHAEDVGAQAVQSARAVYNVACETVSEIARRAGTEERGVAVLAEKPAGGVGAAREHILAAVVGLAGRPRVRAAAAAAAAGLLVYVAGRALVPAVAARVVGERETVLVLGEMTDPITRALVYDLHRRGFCVFVCSTSEKRDRQLEDEYEKVPSPWDQEGGVCHMAATPEAVARLTEFLQREERRLRGVLVVPSSCFFTSGMFTNIPEGQVRSELQENLVNTWAVVTRLLPQFDSASRDKLQVVVFNPSLSQKLNLQYHSLELLMSSTMESLYRILANECGYLADVYQCHLGILNIAGNASNYKYLTINGSHITKALCEPIYELLLSRDNMWVRFKRWLQGPVLYCGKGSRLACWLRSYAPLWLLEFI